ncbi:MAG TPA: carbonic anhydrase [Candidatus Binatia bacterium]|jgi:carbonic anhydrase
MGKFDQFAFSAAPSYDEAATREAFSHAVPLKTVVIYCYDPRAVEIPAAVAKRLGGEVYPGEIIRDAAGKRVASTTTIFPVVVAGGRAVDALRSITIAQHLFGIENVVVAHHSWCGGTSFTADGIISAWRREQGADIADLYERGSICIEDFELSLKRDVALIRAHAGTPRRVNIFGYFYDIDTGALTEVARDMGDRAERAAS